MLTSSMMFNFKLSCSTHNTKWVIPDIKPISSTIIITRDVVGWINDARLYKGYAAKYIINAVKVRCYEKMLLGIKL